VRAGLRRHTRFGVLTCGFVACLGIVAGATPGIAAVTAVTGLPDTTLTVGAAAAAGAGDAADQAMAEAVLAGMVELGRVAAGIEVPRPKKATPEPTVRAAPRWTWDGWASGVAGRASDSTDFGAWRGEPIGAVAVWSDTDAEAQTSLSAVAAYDAFVGDLDVAVGGLVRGETWQEAATGAFVPRWTEAMRNLRAMRAGKGITYVRIAHECNGDWMAWGVNATNLAAYKAGYRLYASIVRKEFPEARLTWSPNGGNHTDVSIDQLYPGDDVVDVVGPDIYDGYPSVTSTAIWKSAATDWSSPATPRGLAAWQQWAARRGKPVALPEWGLPYGDHPDFIQGVHDVLAAHPAAKGAVGNAGRFVYDVYFNAENKFKIYQGPNTSSGTMYRSLTWGN
jgi:Glycosyl hydrolase family 26